MSLNRTGKRATAAGYKEIIRNIQREGIICSGNWMFGFDWDTPDIFANTWEFLHDSEIQHSTFTTEIPFPGTSGYKRYFKEGRILSTNYDDYTGKDRVVHAPKQMTHEELQRGIRWLTRRYYSPSHRAFLGRRAMDNPKLFPQWQGLRRQALMTFLNGYEVYSWNSRMTPALRWLYHAVLPARKYVYLGDFFRGTNFWTRDFPPADLSPVRLGTRSPYADQAGQMLPGKHSRLEPVLSSKVG
jgi:hypothetical protein